MNTEVRAENIDRVFAHDPKTNVIYTIHKTKGSSEKPNVSEIRIMPAAERVAHWKQMREAALKIDFSRLQREVKTDYNPYENTHPRYRFGDVVDEVVRSLSWAIGSKLDV